MPAARTHMIDGQSDDWILGDKIMSAEPQSMVTRQDDSEFSDIVSWVLQALLYGEEQGIGRDTSLCQNYLNNNMTLGDESSLYYMNAVYCVGNYAQIVKETAFGPNPDERGKNQINNGTTGMVKSIPFGRLDNNLDMVTVANGTLAEVKDRGVLNCGVIVPPEDSENSVSESKGLVGMGVEYCKTLAASLFIGNYAQVEFFTFPEDDDSSFHALMNETIDVIVGQRHQRKYDFKSQTLDAFHFSTAYYYGDEAPR